MSSEEFAVRVQNLSKCYQVYDRPEDRLKQYILPRFRKNGRFKKPYYHEFWALKDVSFEIRKGETFGIIGRNGSGKSTLLQLICGTLDASSGKVKVNGRIGALLELGAGFNPEFTGIENVYLSAAVYGLTQKQVEERLPKIAAFADIGDFIEQPVKTYSSGMAVRLAFAVVAHIDADILVIDEALSVGDAYFIQKCMRFLRGFMERGTLLFVSHDVGAVTTLCSRAMLLSRGTVEMIGSPKTATERYLAGLYEETQGETTLAPATASEEPVEEYRDQRADLIQNSNLRNELEIFQFRPESDAFGTGQAKVTSVKLLSAGGQPLAWTIGGEMVSLEVRCAANVAIDQPIIGFLLKDRLGQAIFGDNTFLSYREGTPRAHAGGEIQANFTFRMPVLPAGDYSFSVAIADGTQDSHIQHHWMHDALIIRVHSSSLSFGVVGVPMKRITLITL